MIQSASTKKSLASAGNTVVLGVEGFSTVVINLTGTFTATTVFEYTINGTDWFTLTANVIGSGAGETGATAAGKWVANVTGYKAIRIRCSAYTSGTINVAINANLGQGGSNSSSVSSTAATANTPAIATATPALAANASRKGWSIQNVGTNPLFIRLGTGATTSIFHAVLKGGSADNDGLGASISQMSGVVFTGEISIAGTSPKFVVTEL